MVIATYSREMSLRLLPRDDPNEQAGNIVRARIKGKKLKPVCGDLVQAEPLENEPEWLITGIHERSNELTRPNMRGQVEVLAANLDFLCVVAASKPAPDWFIVDRYLCAAELMDIDAAVIFNKTDLLSDHDEIIEILDVYAELGYATLQCSAETGDGIGDLATLLAGRKSIIVGQSGVGKSSLINRLLGNESLRTGDVSSATGEGKHTTVNSSMLDIGNDGKVIDSPGVRDYAPATQTSEEVIRGFREIRDAGWNCRFANCQHQKEPDCAVKKGVESGAINGRRYQSYKRLFVLSEQLKKR